MRVIYKTLLLLLISVSSYTQQMDNVRFQSVFIYSFTKYIQWENLSDGQFHIQILGNKAMHLELEQGLANKTVNGKPIKISFIDNESQISASHILYVGNEFLPICDKIKQKLISNNTLLVTADFDKKGTWHHMNFVKNESGKLMMEFHEEKMQGLRIRISSELSKMVKHV